MELEKNDEMRGYNSDEVENLGIIINSIAQKTGTLITDLLHQQIILPMASTWYAPEAVDFFHDFSEIVKSKGNVITDIFDSFRVKIELAGKQWAESTGGECPVLSPVEKIELNLSVKEILPNNLGDIILDEIEANKIILKLNNIEEEIKVSYNLI